MGERSAAQEADARSEESFQSADEEDDFDDFDLPQDLGPTQPRAAAADAEAAPAGGAMPPGLDDSDGAGAERWNLRKDGNKEELEPIYERLSESREDVKISKNFSYVLRHAAHKLDVRIRKDGFVRLREIMKLRNFAPYNLEELMAVVYFDKKERYTMTREFDGELLIRANQGHTMKVVEDTLLLEPVTDPDQVHECVHGTYLVHWPFIKRQGISKVARNHIHLANGLPEDGKIRGMRSTAELFVYVDVRKAMEDGVVFFKSKNEVVLTTGLDGWLPTKYFAKAVRIDYNTCDIEHLEFDVEADMPTWAAELAPSGPGEQGTYMVKNLEALIGSCRKRLQEINELKALVDNGVELTEEEQAKFANHAMVYTELQSLEQRFRQHKGHRRETVQEKEARARVEAEAGTVVVRKDRAVTPPWERNKNLESAGMKVSEKEKAEWAALGRRRENPPERERAPKKDDPWEKLGQGRLGAANAEKKEPLEEKERSWREPRGPPREDREPPSWRDSRGGQREEPERSWRDGGKAKAAPREDPFDSKKEDDGARARPRFINSKKMSDGPSWRDRLSQPQAGSPTSGSQQTGGQSSNARRTEEKPPSVRDKLAQLKSMADEEPQWRRPSQGDGSSSGMAMAHGARGSAPPPPSMPAPLSLPGGAIGHPPPQGGGGMTGDSSGTGAAQGGGQFMGAMPMWQQAQLQGGQAFGYGPGVGQQMYYVAQTRDSPQSAGHQQQGHQQQNWSQVQQYGAMMYQGGQGGTTAVSPSMLQGYQQQGPGFMYCGGLGNEHPGSQQGFANQGCGGGCASGGGFGRTYADDGGGKSQEGHWPL
mmetsp:Transcript_62659/g.136068  ORF Transcript_62659/g.136068 Transcript_62659/m.136068 type:complete len:822 (+) Transcript_62659:61-2526(+)